MRKRKLYLSEMLLKCINKEMLVYIKGKNTLLAYNDLLECLHEIVETELWNKQVKEWYITSTTHTRILNIKI